MSTPRNAGIPRGILTATSLGMLVVATTSGCFWDRQSTVASSTIQGSASTPMTSTASSNASSAASSTATKSPRGGVNPVTVNGQDPVAVATAWVVDTSAWDTDTDQSPYQANQRALRWTTQTYQVKFGTTAPLSAPGAAWDEAAAHHAYARVKTTVEPSQDAPSPTKTEVYEVLQADLTAVGSGGWTQPQPSQTWFIVLKRSGSGPWQVDAATLSD